MSKYIDADCLRTEIKNLIEKYSSIKAKGVLQEGYKGGRLIGYEDTLHKLDSLQQEQTDMGEVSDGYHTFNELYQYRMLYNAAFFNELAYKRENETFDVDYDVHKSKKHSDGEECFGGGWFIVMAELPTGQISNHYELKYWDLFEIPEKEIANKWDGHTPQEAAERLHKYLQQEQHETDGDDGKFVKILVRKEYAEQIQRLGDEIHAGQSSFIGAMNQQEQPEMDLEKIIEQTYHDGSVVDTSDMDHVTYENIARHFYSLGYNARKEE